MIPVIEIFGPVIEGEGTWAGKQVHFLRTGGCDYRCTWCDTKYAVEPAEVKKNSTMMDPLEIAAQLNQNMIRSRVWSLCISGGNPVMWNLYPVIQPLKLNDRVEINVETQGTLWRDWVNEVDQVTVSPKPPSSGEITDLAKLTKFLDNCTKPRICLKIVVFNSEDVCFAQHIYHHVSSLGIKDVDYYLQIGTAQAYDLADSRQQILDHYADLCGLVTKDCGYSHWKVMPQLHTLMYGQKRGV